MGTREGRWSTIASLVVWPAATFGQLVFDPGNSSIVFRHTEDSSSSSLRKNTRLFSFAAANAGNAFDFTSAFLLNGSTTNASAGVDPITNFSTASFRLPSGTGCAQSNPSPTDYTGFSELQLSFDMLWNVGPTATSTSIAPYSSYGIAGLVGNGGFSRLIQALTIENLSTTNTVLRTANLNADLTFSTPGAFSQVVTRSAVFSGGSGPLAAGTKLRISGTIKFRAKNDDSPSEIELLDGEFGALTNLYTAQFPAGGGSWQDPLNWLPSADLPPATFPNGDVRARMVATDLNVDTRAITLNLPVDVQELEIDDLDNYTINAATPTDHLGVGVLRIGNGNGNGQVTINADLAAASGLSVGPKLEVVVDSAGGLVLNGKILASPAAGEVHFSGRGPVTLNSDNSANLSNPVIIGSGIFTATSPGALGSGTVAVRGGKLVYAANGISANPSPIRVEDRGQVTFPLGGPIPQASEFFDVAAYSAIEGGTAQRNALLLNNGTNGGNLTLAPDAMIIRRALTPVVPGLGQDVRGLGTTPQYIYGIANDVVPGQGLVFDTASPGPYRGLGVGRGQVVFGTPNPNGGPATHFETLQLNGDTRLAALPGGRLILNSRIFFSGGTLTVAGGGEVVINNVANSFNGQINVTDAALVLNGGFGGAGFPGHIVVNGPNAELRGGGELFQGFVDRVDLVQGTISPGDITPGSLRINNLSMPGGPANSVLKFTLDRPETSDFLRVFGSFTGSGRVEIEPTSAFDAGIYTLFRFDQPGSLATLQIGDLPPDFQATYAIVPGTGGSQSTVGLLIVSPLGVPLGEWNNTSGGSFDQPANWNGDVPGGVASVANFGTAITAPSTVNVLAPRTLGTINFYNRMNSYDLAGPGTITFDGALDQVGINIAHGSHTISAPVVFNVSPRITSTILGAGVTFTQDMVAAPGLTLTTRNARVQVKNLRIDQLDIAGDIVRVLAVGSPNSPVHAGRVKSLNIAANVPPLEPTQSSLISALDLSNSALIIDYDGVSPIDAINTYLQRGYNGGIWSGNNNGAITSSTLAAVFSQNPNPVPRPALGLFDNASLGLLDFAGQPLDATSLIIAYTLAGDADLDLLVSINDFASLAAHFNQPGNWGDGDFSYDGVVNINDFAILASNFNLALPLEEPRESVPEPASGFFGALTMLTVRRPSRRCRV